MPNQTTSQGASRPFARPVPVPTAPDARAQDSTETAVARTARAWGASASKWVFTTAESFRRESRGDRVLHEFADLIDEARESGEIEAALVGLVHETSEARRVELFRASCRPGDDGVVPVAASGEDQAPASSRVDAGHGHGRPDLPLRLPLRLGDGNSATLRLLPFPGQRWDPRLVRRLTTLCAMAAAAERGLRPGRPARDPAPVDALRKVTFLDAVLSYALAQSNRHNEPVSLLCIAVDRLAAIQQLHGPEIVETAVRRVAETIGNMIRASDVVARLDDDRVVALLPNADAENALRIAEAVRRAIEAAGTASMAMPVLTASIGVANYPTHADSIDSLLEAADAAMARAQSEGRNRVVAAAPVGARVSPSAGPCGE